MKRFAIVVALAACVVLAGCGAIKETFSPKGFLVLHAAAQLGAC